MKYFVGIIISFIFVTGAVADQSGLDSVNRENGKLGSEAIEWINEHKPDNKSGKFNHYYWWHINGEYYAIHKSNIRQHASSKSGAKTYITETLGQMIKNDVEANKKTIYEIHEKIAALASLGMEPVMIEKFLADYPKDLVTEAKKIYVYTQIKQ